VPAPAQRRSVPACRRWQGCRRRQG
jgi:hypothetical protein